MFISLKLEKYYVKYENVSVARLYVSFSDNKCRKSKNGSDTNANSLAACVERLLPCFAAFRTLQQ